MSDDSDIDERDDITFAGGEEIGGATDGAIGGDCTGKGCVASAANGEMSGCVD